MTIGTHMQQRPPAQSVVKQNLAKLFAQYLQSKNKNDLAKIEDALKSDYEGIDELVGGRYITTIVLMDLYFNYSTSVDKTTLKRIYKLLLEHGAKLDSSVLSHGATTWANAQTILHEVYSETLIRGDHGNFDIIAKSKRLQTPSKEDIVKQLGDRKLKQKQLTDAKRMLVQLVKDEVYDDQSASAIYKELEAAKDISIDPSEYPVCLSKFVAEGVKPDSLISIFLHLQYTREVIPSPYTKEELQRHNDKDTKKALIAWSEHPDNYDLKRLDEFLDPKNHTKSLLEMRFYPGITGFICMLAVHQDASVDIKTKAIALLHHMENVTDVEQAILSAGEANFNSAQVIATELDGLRSEVEELKPLKAQFEAINSRVASLEKQMREMAELMKGSSMGAPKPVSLTAPGLFNK